jgi:threonine/homoserine/homoserine lactone efflux protein
MGAALGNVLTLAVAIAIFPVPVIASVLLIGTDRGRAKGFAFVVAWYLGLVAVGGIVLAFADAEGASDDGEPATWVNVLLLVLGVVVLAAAVQQWRGRPREGEEAATPGWMKAIDEFSVVKAAGVGIALSALNPKNILLTAAAAAEIAEYGLSAAKETVVLLAFALIATVGVVAPLVLSLALGSRSAEVLEGLKDWMGRNSGVIMAVLFLLIGAKLIGDAISGFAS